jgi:hypothetical protein
MGFSSPKPPKCPKCGDAVAIKLLLQTFACRNKMGMGMLALSNAFLPTCDVWECANCRRRLEHKFAR